MFIAAISCDWKCLRESNLPLHICQNSHTSKMDTHSYDILDLIKRFNDNELSECIIFAGLEPLLQFEEIYEFIKIFRDTNNEDIIIYTGYYLDEVKDKIDQLRNFKNIIIKFGRYKPNSNKIFDDNLKIYLASDNQYSIRL
jgi:pyruvate-formate lyase-activating enzyme